MTIVKFESIGTNLKCKKPFKVDKSTKETAVDSDVKLNSPNFIRFEPYHIEITCQQFPGKVTTAYKIIKFIIIIYVPGGIRFGT